MQRVDAIAPVKGAFPLIRVDRRVRCENEPSRAVCRGEERFRANAEAESPEGKTDKATFRNFMEPLLFPPRIPSSLPLACTACIHQLRLISPHTKLQRLLKNRSRLENYLTR